MEIQKKRHPFRKAKTSGTKRVKSPVKMEDKFPEIFSGEFYRRQNQVNGVKSRCIKLGIPFDLTPEDINWVTHCPILGLELKRGPMSNCSPSIDRIIPEAGYVKGNIRIISKLANVMKNNATREQLEIFSKNILDYMDGKI